MSMPAATWFAWAVMPDLALQQGTPSTSYTDRMEMYDFAKVSVTAMGPVIGRGEVPDIPFAKEILSYLQERSQPPSAEFVTGAREHAAFFEARFKAVSRLLVEYRATQVFDLASGFSPRGFLRPAPGREPGGFDPASQGLTYVEVDLPGMIEQKREIAIALLGAIPAHLKFCCASVLNRDELMQGLTHFRKEPIAVTSEGLLRYLTFDEKAQLAANVRHILGMYGGMWITPDIHLRKWSHQRTARDVLPWLKLISRRVRCGLVTGERKPRSGVDWNFSAQLGRDINANYFDDLGHARSFFESCGFHVEERPLLEGIRQRLSTLPRASPDLLAELQERRIYTMTMSH